MRLCLMVCVGFKRINWFSQKYIPPGIHINDINRSFNINNDNNDNDTLLHSVQEIKILEEESRQWQLGQTEECIIDVWWMVADGGFIMLIPYIMKLHNFWEKTQLRMNLVTNKSNGDQCLTFYSERMSCLGVQTH